MTKVNDSNKVKKTKSGKNAVKKLIKNLDKFEIFKRFSFLNSKSKLVFT